MDNTKFTLHLKENQDRLVVFGSGFYGDRIVKTLKQNDIMPICLCDNNAERVGSIVEDVQVKSVADVLAKIANPIFIISPYEKVYQDAIITQLKNIPELQMIEYYTLKHFFANIEAIYFETILEKMEFQTFTMKEYEPEKTEFLYTPAVDLVVTERCSLKCKDCSNLMQYFEKPKDFDANRLYDDIDRVDTIFDAIREFRILGGEPFMHRDIYELIAYAQTKQSITCVMIYTNATIPPNKEKLKELRSDNLFFLLTKYADLSKQIDAWVEVLEELNIAYVNQEFTEWMDCGRVKEYHRTPEALMKLYNACCVLDTISLVCGKLFRCPYASSLYLLGAMPQSDMEYVDLYDSKKSEAELQSDIKRLVYQIPYIKACDFCNGRTPGYTPEIPAAQQTKTPLSYHKYE